jgi:hypothetical protein
MNKRTKQFSIVFAFIMIIWGLYSLIISTSIDTLTIASSFIIILVGFTYPIIIFYPKSNKIVSLIEGLFFTIFGLLILNYPINILFIVIGIILIVIAITSYLNLLSKIFTYKKK